MLPEGVGLLFQEGGEGAFGKSGRGRRRDLLQGSEIGVEARSVVAESPSGDNSAPLGGQIADVLEVLGRDLSTCHRLSCLRVIENGANGLSFLLYSKGLYGAKQVLTSWAAGTAGPGWAATGAWGRIHLARTSVATGDRAALDATGSGLLQLRQIA